MFVPECSANSWNSQYNNRNQEVLLQVTKFRNKSTKGCGDPDGLSSQAKYKVNTMVYGTYNVGEFHESKQ